MPAPKSFTVVDLILIAAIVAIAGALLPFLESGLADTVAVYRDNSLIAEYPLDHDRTFSVGAPTGFVVIEVRQGSVRVVESGCPRGICRHALPIRKAGQQIVCAPNHLTIEISSRHATDGPDAIAE